MCCSRNNYILIPGLLMIIFVSGMVGWLFANREENGEIKSPIDFVKPRILEKYSFDNLIQYNFTPGEITIEDTIDENDNFTSHLFSFTHDPDLDGENDKVTTGLLNVPSSNEKFPLVLMLRGYVDQSLYQTGMGTSKSGEVFAENGFMSIAPDFLGYAGSDENSANILESRFQTYTTTLQLLESLNQIDSWDGKNVFIWGHSNGGQIALTILEITGENYPTTLWAPVSKPFPYSILYYTDESDDGGKLLRSAIAKFEEDYNSDNYSLTNYFNRINSPIQLHQGTADDAVPVSWSNQLSNILDSNEIEAEYFTYPGADHNMRPYWDTVVQRDVEFFNKYTEEVD